MHICVSVCLSVCLSVCICMWKPKKVLSVLLYHSIYSFEAGFLPELTALVLLARLKSAKPSKDTGMHSMPGLFCVYAEF